MSSFENFLLFLKFTKEVFVLLIQIIIIFSDLFYHTEVIRDWLVKPIRDQHVKPKGTAVFTCVIAKDTPNIKWYKGYDEIPLEPTDKTEIIRDGNHIHLKVKNAMPEDVDEYAVEIEGKRYPAKLTIGGIKILPSILEFCMCPRQNNIHRYTHKSVIRLFNA